MSTYNGGCYIKQQLKSIYNQSFKDFTLYIRDDGSTDTDFLSLLQSLQKQYGFYLYMEENVGFLRSFVKLLKKTTEDIVAFADQDDIWLEDKLEHGISWFDCNDRCDMPMLFHAAYDCIDMDNHIVGHFYFPDIQYDFRRSITENHYSGFAMMINRKLRDMMLLGNVDNIDYHDWWAAMIVQAFGYAHSDSKVCALHRVHGDNVTTYNLKTRVIWLCKVLTEESEIHKRSKEFERCFGTKLNVQNKKVLDMFTCAHYNLTYAIKKGLSLKRWRPVLSSEIAMRVLMLIGKV